MSTAIHIVVFTEKADTPEIPKPHIIEWSNPYYYDKPRDKSTAVYAPNHPKIEEAYVKAGKVAWRPEGNIKVVTVNEEVLEPVEDPTTTFGEPDMEPDTRPDPSEVEQPLDQKNWRDLSWPKMRSLATDFTDEPVKSKDQAKEILEQAESEGKL